MRAQKLSASDMRSSRRLSRKRVVAVVYSNYPWDPRVRRAAEALVAEGAEVEVICLRESDDEPLDEVFNEVRITRVPLKRRRGGKLRYIIQYGSFIMVAGVHLARRAIRHRLDLVHVHNMPDILVFSALVPKILGTKIILDLHDPMPELMGTIFGVRESGFSVWVLKKLEKLSIRFADAVITVNEGSKRLFSKRSASPEKITVVMNSPDESIFQVRQPSERDTGGHDRHSNPFIVMYHGTIVERHGLDLAVTAVQKIRKTIPDIELRIYGAATPFLENVMNLVSGLELSEAVRYMGSKNLEQIAEAIGECDVGIIPNRRSRFTEINMPTRIFEYLSQGKPVIAPMTSAILDYFGPTELVLFEPDHADELAAKILYVFRYPAKVAEIVTRGQEMYRKHKWSTERFRLVSLVQEILKEKDRLPAVAKRMRSPVGTKRR
jgi:glycosyltransferase involved in cell wall biosynthesis